MGTDNFNDKEKIENLFEKLNERGVKLIFVENRQKALEKVLSLIPEGSAVANGSSTTLKEIGLIDYLMENSGKYNYLNLDWLAENDAVKRYKLRGRLSLSSEYFLGSVQAICENGEVIGVDASGSRQAFYIFGPPNIIWVAGINKLVPNLEEGLKRIKETALPKEDKRMHETAGKGSFIGKIVLYEKEKPGRITLVLVDEHLGY